MDDIETVSCSSCGSRKAETLYELSDSLYNIPGDFTSNRCLNCGLIYLSPRPKSEAIGNYYPSNYANFRPPIESEKFALMRWMRQRKLTKRRRLIERFSQRTSGNLLDVGSATGLFLNEMAQSGWRVSGVEPDLHAAELARSYFNLDVFAGLFRDAPLQPNSFDVITFWDVIEHTYSPRKELEFAANLMRPGGLLTLSIPNWNSEERKIFGKYWQGFDAPRHLYVFTDEVLSAILDDAGFTIIDRICFMPGYFSFIISLERWLKSKSPPLAAIARSFLNLPGIRLPFEPWFSLNNMRGIGPVIAYFSRKKS